MRKITLQTPLDMHIHFRDNEMLDLVAPLTAKTFSGAVIMPNLVPPVTTKEAVVSYNIAYKVLFIPVMIQSIILTPFWSAVTDAYTKNDYSWIKRSLRKLNLLTLIFWI